MAECAVDDCHGEARAQGLCRKHYNRWHRRGTTHLPASQPKPQRACSVPDCDGPVKARGWCSTHYFRWYETGSLDLGIRERGNFRLVEPLADRFWRKVNKTEDCWLWTGGATREGYGAIWSGPGGRRLMAHRVAWELLRGPIPEGLHIDHLCRRPPCVNPDHLEPVTPSVNTARGYSGPIRAAAQLARNACIRGHEYTPENTSINVRGARVCKTCRREDARRRRAQKKQE